TTKARGEGTGLGLSTTCAIVTSLGGFIEVDTVPGRGTAFHIYLPRAAGAGESSSAGAQPLGSPEVIGGETILVVEDEDAVRDFASKALCRHGYQVLQAANAEAAMSLLEHERAKVHLLLTDVVLPGVDGCELALRVVRTNPQTPVIFTTGYVDRKLDLDAFPSSACLLQKPFTARALLKKTRELLDSA